MNISALDAKGCYVHKFDKSSPNWVEAGGQRLIFLHSCETRANLIKQARGYIFLNDVLDMIGIDRTRDGQIVGWINECIDFEVTNKNDGTTTIMFRTEGNILDKAFNIKEDK